MIELPKLTNYLDNLLDIEKVHEDLSNNGLQVEGNKKIHKIIFGVDACLELCKLTVKENADFIFVHHGLSWREGFQRLTGHSAQIFSRLFKNDISLYAAHLPLDAHLELSHNAQIAQQLKLHKIKTFCEYAKIDIGLKGELNEPTTADNLKSSVDKMLDTEAQIFGNDDKKIKKIGIISGGPGSMGIESAYKNDLDCLITGEIKHSSWHLINDLGLTVIAAGHYRTETPGIIAVMEKVQSEIDVECQFIDLPTGL